MKLTRLSLLYLATYLAAAGVALLLVPDVATKLLLSNGTYDDVFPRLTGGVLLALGILIIQIVRHRVEALYPWTLVVRVMLLAVFVALYLKSSDPFFLSLFVIVGLGVVMTATGYYLDRREAGGAVGVAH